MSNRRPITGAGIAVIILAACLGIAIAGAILIAAWQGRPLSQEAATMLSTVLGAIVGAIAGYLGGSRRSNGRDERRPSEREESQ